MEPYDQCVRAILALSSRSVLMFLVLVYGTVISHNKFVRAAPTQAHVQSASASTTANTANRDGPFQILADGSQDLAALVGLFATNGVEKYTIDYTRGFVPPATAPLSLLGLLGYVRALLKLSFGVNFCERTGFSISSLRSYAGVKRSDVAQGEKIVDVQYLERSIQDDSVQWRLVKSVPHTQESLPLIVGGGTRVLRDRRPHEASFGIAMCRLPQTKGTISLTIGLYGVCLAFASSLSSFPVLMFTHRWTWTKVVASIGLPVSVLLGGLPWCLIHIIEHLPFGSCDWFRSDWKNGVRVVNRSPDDSGQSLSRKNHFAYFAKEDHFYIFDCHAAGSFRIWLTRIASCCAATCITVAYVCQYIELRSASAKRSGIWLDLQGALAVLRIIAWDWAPSALGFSSEIESRWTDQRDHLLKNSLTELEITLCWVSMPEGPLAALQSHDAPLKDLSTRLQAPRLPKWLVENIDSIELVKAFALARRLRAKTVHDGDFYHLHDAAAHWDMPDKIFARWLQLRCRNRHNVDYDASKRRKGIATWVCRILKDSGGMLHVVPGISLHVHFADRTIPPTTIIMFSRFQQKEANMFCFPSGGPNETEVLYHGIENISDDTKGLAWIAKRSLDSFHQQVVDELWDELILALGVLDAAEP